MTSAYFEKLKDPRWQKKRLEVLAKQNWACELCGDVESTLHVHHKQYFKGREPWEYEIGQLAVLCKSCHEEDHLEEDPLLLAASFVGMDGPESRATVASLISGFCGLGMSNPYAAQDPDVYITGELARELSGWVDSALKVHEKVRLIELAKSDMASLTASLRAYIASKE